MEFPKDFEEYTPPPNWSWDEYEPYDSWDEAWYEQMDECMAIEDYNAATMIQKIWRGYRVRNEYVLKFN
jgi:hypothetical protein